MKKRVEVNLGALELGEVDSDGGREVLVDGLPAIRVSMPSAVSDLGMRSISPTQRDELARRIAGMEELYAKLILKTCRMAPRTT